MGSMVTTVTQSGGSSTFLRCVVCYQPGEPHGGDFDAGTILCDS